MNTVLPPWRRLALAAHHPVVTARVLLVHWRRDPARLLAVLLGRLFPDRAWSRPASSTRRVWRRAQAERAWQEGRWEEAIRLSPAGSTRRRRYLGEIAALDALVVPASQVRSVRPVPARVLHVVSNALPYTQAGYTVRTHAIVRAQRDAGLQPEVATRWGWPVLHGVVDLAGAAQLDGVPYHRLLPEPPFPVTTGELLRRNANALTSLIEQVRPEVVHAAGPHLNAAPALAAARCCGLPLVYEVRGFLEQTWAGGDPARRASDRYRLTRQRETALMQQADAVVTLSHTMRQDIAERGVDPARVTIVPNSVDAGLLTARPDRRGFRHGLGIGDDEFVVGSVSGLIGYEGFPTLLAAARLLVEAGLPVRVLLVGDGPERDRLRALAARTGLGERALLPGRVPPGRAPDAMAALDVLCVPRVDSPVCRTVTPIKPVEAMALGVPVVASDLPALAEVLCGGRAGVLVPAGDPVALAGALVGLAEDGAQRAELIAAARAEVSARRTWQAAATVYDALYARLAGRYRAGDLFT